MYHAIELSVQVRLNRYGVLKAISYKMAKKVLVMLCHSKKSKETRGLPSSVPWNVGLRMGNGRVDVPLFLAFIKVVFQFPSPQPHSFLPLFHFCILLSMQTAEQCKPENKATQNTNILSPSFYAYYPITLSLHGLVSPSFLITLLQLDASTVQQHSLVVAGVRQIIQK